MADHPTSTEIADDVLVGQLIAGKYRVLKLLAYGGMGRVYKGTQEPLGRSVAIKIMAPLNLRPDRAEVYKGRFFREASLCSRLSHPNTVTIHDYGVLEDGTYYLVMEFLGGWTLREALLDSGAFDIARTVNIARQIASSLVDAHGAGVIHRDLKPPNVILVDRGGDRDFVKVVDFGLVKSLEGGAEDDLTGEGSFVGSPVYMAPEQFFDPQAADQRSEIYAFGVIMYEMLAGRPPFARLTGVTTQDVIYQHMSKPVPSLKETCLTMVVPPSVEEVVMRCLEKRPQDRYTSMAEVFEVLSELQVSIISGRMPALDRPAYRVASLDGSVDITVDHSVDETPPATPRGTGEGRLHRVNTAERRAYPSSPSGEGRSYTSSPSREGRAYRSGERSVADGDPWPSDESVELPAAAGLERKRGIGLWLGLGFVAAVLLIGASSAVALLIGKASTDMAPATGPNGGETTVAAQNPVATPGQDVAPKPQLRWVIESRPAGATVFRDTVQLGETPLELSMAATEVPENAPVVFRLVKDGFEETELEVPPSAERERRLSATLSEKVADAGEPAAPAVNTRRRTPPPVQGKGKQPTRKATGPPAGDADHKPPTLDIKMER